MGLVREDKSSHYIPKSVSTGEDLLPEKKIGMVRKVK